MEELVLDIFERWLSGHITTEQANIELKAINFPIKTVKLNKHSELQT